MLARVLWGCVIALLALWALGRVWRLLGNLIHLLLIVAVIVIIYNLVFARKRTY